MADTIVLSDPDQEALIKPTPYEIALQNKNRLHRVDYIKSRTEYLKSLYLRNLLFFIAEQLNLRPSYFYDVQTGNKFDPVNIKQLCRYCGEGEELRAFLYHMEQRLLAKAQESINKMKKQKKFMTMLPIFGWIAIYLNNKSLKIDNDNTGIESTLGIKNELDSYQVSTSTIIEDMVSGRANSYTYIDWQGYGPYF